MPLNQSSILYPVNTTTVDTGAGIDVRLLDSVAGTADSTQTASFTHTNNNVERTFDPATGGVTNTNNAGTTLFKAGWALRLAEDMTASDDTKCDAFLNSGTLTVGIVIRISQTGGTYAGASYTPTFRASLWRYNPSTDTGTLIAAGTTTATWTIGGIMDDTATPKNLSISIAVPNTTFGAVKGTAAEIFYLQVGMNTGSIPAPTLGTGAYTATLTVGTANTNITFAAGQAISQVCYVVGSSAGTASVTGTGAPVKPTAGTSSGTSTVAGSLMAHKLTTGTSTGTASVNGTFGAVKVGTGSAAGIATVSGAPSIVKGAIGTVRVAEPPPAEQVPADYALLDNGQIAKLVADISPYPLYTRL